MLNVSGTVMFLPEGKVQRWQQVAECSTVMERVCVCVCLAVSVRVCKRLTLITQIVPLVFAMTVIVIAAAFGSSANRSVMSSQAAAEAICLFRNGHQKVLKMTQRNITAVWMFYFSYLQ